VFTITVVPSRARLVFSVIGGTFVTVVSRIVGWRNMSVSIVEFFSFSGDKVSIGMSIKCPHSRLSAGRQQRQAAVPQVRQFEAILVRTIVG
jgi:hypothetical protein